MQDEERAQQTVTEAVVREARRAVRGALRSIGRSVGRTDQAVAEAGEVAAENERLAREEVAAAEAERAHEERIQEIVEDELRPKFWKEKLVQKKCKKMGLDYAAFADIEAAYRGIAEETILELDAA